MDQAGVCVRGEQDREAAAFAAAAAAAAAAVSYHFPRCRHTVTVLIYVSFCLVPPRKEEGRRRKRT